MLNLINLIIIVLLIIISFTYLINIFRYLFKKKIFFIRFNNILTCSMLFLMNIYLLIWELIHLDEYSRIVIPMVDIQNQEQLLEGTVLIKNEIQVYLIISVFMLLMVVTNYIINKKKKRQ